MVADDPCDGVPLVIHATINTTGEITSPNYPLPYPNNADCQWHIYVDDGLIVQFTFVEFDVELR